MSQSFGKFLKQKRQEKNLTQKELAELLIISPSAISKWEKDVAYPDITLLPKLSKILEVSEHELITATIDNNDREEKKQAKKWRTFSLTFSLFWYIAYTLTIIPCFIVNLAVNKGLTWFWIVLSALILAFSFTNLPKLIKKNKLLLIPLSNYLALELLLGVCAIYTSGNWFFIASLSILLGLSCIFVPIYIANFNLFSKIKKFNDFVSIAFIFVLILILLIIIDFYTVNNGYINYHWFTKIALPIVLTIYAIINILLSVRFFEFNKLLKTSIILFIINIILVLCPLIIKADNLAIQKEIDSFNIFKSNLSVWSTGLQNNISFLIFLTILVLSVAFFISGIIKHLKSK